MRQPPLSFGLKGVNVNELFIKRIATKLFVCNEKGRYIFLSIVMPEVFRTLHLTIEPEGCYQQKMLSMGMVANSATIS